MIGPLLTHIAPCETVELFIDQRVSSVEGGCVALAPALGGARWVRCRNSAT